MHGFCWWVVSHPLRRADLAERLQADPSLRNTRPVTDTPAGWYPAPDDPLNLRWWDGSTWSEATKPVPPTRPVVEAHLTRPPRRRPLGCLGWSIVGVATVAIVTITFTLVIDNTDTGKRIKAETACQDAVSASLKAPSTAEFTTGKTTGTYPSYTTAGWVDAENSFGAQIRTKYACEVVGSDDGETWTVKDVATRD